MANGNGNGNGKGSWTLAVSVIGLAVTLIIIAAKGSADLSARPTRTEVRADIKDAETRLQKTMIEQQRLIIYRLDKLDEAVKEKP